MNKYEEAYEKNEEFRIFVDKYCNDYGVTKEMALGHLLVQVTYDTLYELIEGGENG